MGKLPLVIDDENALRDSGAGNALGGSGVHARSFASCMPAYENSITPCILWIYSIQTGLCESLWRKLGDFPQNGESLNGGYPQSAFLSQHPERLAVQS
jgi:hypothetical protein